MSAQEEGTYLPTAAELERDRVALRRLGSEVSWIPVPGPEGEADSGRLIVRLDHPKAKMPAIAKAGDAGLDLHASETVVVPSGQFRDVPCGISIQLPVEHWARITGRSSTLRKRGLLVNDSVIDNGYTGPIYFGVWNLGHTSAVVAEGERLAQLILHRIARVPVMQVAAGVHLLSRDGRGTAGFGSTGR